MASYIASIFFETSFPFSVFLSFTDNLLKNCSKSVFFNKEKELLIDNKTFITLMKLVNQDGL